MDDVRVLHVLGHGLDGLGHLDDGDGVGRGVVFLAVAARARQVGCFLQGGGDFAEGGLVDGVGVDKRSRACGDLGKVVGGDVGGQQLQGGGERLGVGRLCRIRQDGRECEAHDAVCINAQLLAVVQTQRHAGLVRGGQRSSQRHERIGDGLRV